MEVISLNKILITAIGGDIGNGIIKSLKNNKHELIYYGCDVVEYNYSFNDVNYFYEAPSYKNETIWLQFILNILKDNQVDYFWPVTEPEIVIVNRNIHLFDFCKVIINASNILDVALDKGQTATALRKAGINTPKTYFSIGDCDNMFPKVVKESFSCGSHGIKIVNDIKELYNVFSKMKNPIIQDYVGTPEKEYTMAVFSDGKVVNSITFQRTLGFGGMTRYIRLAHETSLNEIALKIAELFNLHGSINVQMREENGSFFVFEINPRISSTIGFRTKLGFNDVSWWLNYMMGNTIEKYNVPSENIVGVRGVEEKLFYTDKS